MRSLVLLLAAVAAGCSLMPQPTTVSTSDNPLLTPSPLPYGYPQFDRIKPQHFLPAFEVAMARHLAEIDTITSNPADPSFDNTIVAMETAGTDLQRVATIFGGLVATHGIDALQAINTKISPQLAKHEDAVYLNPALFQRIDALYEQRDGLGLDAESRRLLERYHSDFVRAGARLSGDDKDRMRAINTRLSELTTAFRQNLTADTNDLAVVVSDAEQLVGLSESERSSARAAAEEQGVEGYLLTLQLPTLQPVLADLEQRDLRERIHRASVARGNRDNEYDNKAIVLEIVRLRAERAQLLGFDTHADYVLANATAGTTDAVNNLLARLAEPAAANARREAARLQQAVDNSGGDFELAVWDWPYYREQVREADYAFDQAALKPYFELDRVLQDGAFYMAEQLYGLQITEVTSLPVYHPDVRVFEVFEADGASLGLFIFDPFARPTKRGGAWMNSYVSQSHLRGTRPVVANHLNISKPPKGEPVLLTPSEANTLFHEFGHALHGLFSDVRYPYFSGTSVPRDFVEYPSQVHEMWTFWPEVMRNYAVHYDTGEPLPAELIERYRATQTFNQGYDTTEYLAASILDQAWHQHTPETIPDDVTGFEAEALARAGVALERVPPRYHSTYFAHIFAGGYSAGYYSYVWSEVLDADTVAWLTELGGLTRANGDRLREGILSKGGSVDAQALYRAFRGQDATIAPLLDRRGLN